jgi:hypothetical protein
MRCDRSRVAALRVGGLEPERRLRKDFVGRHGGSRAGARQRTAAAQLPGCGHRSDRSAGDPRIGNRVGLRSGARRPRRSRPRQAHAGTRSADRYGEGGLEPRARAGHVGVVEAIKLIFRDVDDEQIGGLHTSICNHDVDLSDRGASRLKHALKFAQLATFACTAIALAPSASIWRTVESAFSLSLE